MAPEHKKPRMDFSTKAPSSSAGGQRMWPTWGPAPRNPTKPRIKIRPYVVPMYPPGPSAVAYYRPVVPPPGVASEPAPAPVRAAATPSPPLPDLSELTNVPPLLDPLPPSPERRPAAPPSPEYELFTRLTVPNATGTRNPYRKVKVVKMATVKL